GVVEQNRADRTGDRDLLFHVEQHALVAAEDETRRRILRSDAADVEAADAVLAALEQLLENRQLARTRKRVDVFVLAAQTERQPVRLVHVPHAFDERLVEVRVAAEAGEIERRGEALAGRREDRLVHRVVDEARRHLADDALAVLADEQRIAQERV